MKFNSYALGIAAKYCQIWGLGVDPISRKTKFPNCFSNPSQTGALRILVDYTSTITTSGNNRVVATFSAARALCVTGRGDRILMGGGLSSTPSSVSNTQPAPGRFEISGFSLLYPTIVGTYDPSDPYNQAKDNILYHTWNMQYDSANDKWSTINIPAVIGYNIVPNFQFITNQIFQAEHNVGTTVGWFTSGMRKYGIRTLAGNDGYGVEDCVFDGLSDSYASSVTGETNMAAPSTFARHNTRRLCGYADSIALNGSNLGGSGALNLIIEDTINLGAGNNTRAYADQEDSGVPTIVSIAGASNSGRVIQVNDTSLVVPGMMWSVTAGTGQAGNTNGSVVMSVQDSTHFLCDVVPGTNLDGVTSVVSFYKLAANTKRHSWYLDSSNRNVTLRRNISVQNSSNDKFTGGPYTLEDHWNLYNPISWITDPRGNASIAQWPNNAPVRSTRHTAVCSDDIDVNASTGAGGGRGWGPQNASQNFGIVSYWQNNTAYTTGNIVQRGQDWYVCITGGTSDNTGSRGPTGTALSITDGSVTWAWYAMAGQTTNNSSILLNQNNPQNASSKTGVVIASNHTTDAIACYGELRNSLLHTWSPQDTTNIAQTTKYWQGNITDDATGYLNTTVAPAGSSGGSTGVGNVNRTALANSLINGLISITPCDNLRQFMPGPFSTATVVNANTAFADQKATVYNMFRLAVYKVQPYKYTDNMSRLFRRTIGW